MKQEFRSKNSWPDRQEARIKNYARVCNSIFGFTLIELLVVISILGILAGLLVTNVAGIRERARDTQRKSDLYQIKQALKMYHNDFSDYPATGTDSSIKGCGTTGTPADCIWGQEFKKNDTIYMKQLPKDPSSTADSPVYYNYSRTDEDNFVLYATLENASDKDIVSSQERCSGAAGNNYYVCAD